MDMVDEIARAHRELIDGERKVAVLRRRYDAEIEDVWDACTDAGRLKRWFLPVTGDLRLGGRYQFEGNAGGEILECEPPRRFKVSWVMGDAPGLSEVEVELTPDGDGTRFELRHTAEVPPEMWDGFGPGAVGVGWDLAVLGLGLHLAGGEQVDEATFHLTEEGRRVITAAAAAWGRASEAAGVPPERAAAHVAAVTAFYAPEPEA
ncbi:SRPBCC family protein [Actinomadura sp. ATCC 31491]|uniref:SRPBCC family protein n=1 Tax=Actinomadura luzonensis TaxID=2805427 RepID=A0ABT0G5R1_9ACTN|nr:SRPBCC family protein [Actinomadura luzonensis]MCK2219421.1 SRPBCC family protein [Actinomadura luzonensis]